MNRFKAFYCIVFLLLFNLLVSACKFPDNILDINNITNYKLDKIKFGITSLDEFASLVGSKPDYKIGNIFIYNTLPPDNTVYKKVRVGFKQEKLDWIEFALNDNTELSKITDVYGKPDNINTIYNKIFDYYDYKFFNISTDKEHVYAKAITIFNLPESSLDKIIDLSNSIPNWQELNTFNILGLKPGYSLESDLNSSYPELLPVKEEKIDSSSVYILDKELGKAKSQYQKIELFYINGLLNWIDIIPVNISLNQIVKVWSTEYKIESINKKYDLYEFAGIIAVIDKTNKKVVKIGIVTSK